MVGRLGRRFGPNFRRIALVKLNSGEGRRPKFDDRIRLVGVGMCDGWSWGVLDVSGVGGIGKIRLRLRLRSEGLESGGLVRTSEGGESWEIGQARDVGK